MAYIVSKQNRFHAVTYDGLDPTTGKERRRWHLAGESRDCAEEIAANLTQRTDLVRDGGCSKGGTWVVHGERFCGDSLVDADVSRNAHRLAVGGHRRLVGWCQPS